MITVDDTGENSIVVAPGANAHLQPQDVALAFDRHPDAKVMLIQLEIPMETVRSAAQYARDKGLLVILNPAPANGSVADIFHLIDVITPNENEAEMLSGIRIKDLPSARRAAERLQQLGVKSVIITLGKQGAAVLHEGKFRHIPAPVVDTVDSTAAGDVFNGALATGLADGRTIEEAVAFACNAAAIAVTRLGAQSSIPYRNEVLFNILN